MSFLKEIETKIRSNMSYFAVYHLLSNYAFCDSSSISRSVHCWLTATILTDAHYVNVCMHCLLDNFR